LQLFDFFYVFLCRVLLLSMRLASKEGTTFYLLNFPLANYHLETGIIEQTYNLRSMRPNGVDFPLDYKGCGRPARGNGGLLCPCIYTSAAHTCQWEL